MVPRRAVETWAGAVVDVSVVGTDDDDDER